MPPQMVQELELQATPQIVQNLRRHHTRFGIRDLRLRAAPRGIGAQQTLGDARTRFAQSILPVLGAPRG
eukprot:11116724-Alexandrium_andersonii.AAC.1